ncbi:secreted protein [Melampsora americana]|nr:secreted protein [Melampsora americana]
MQFFNSLQIPFTFLLFLNLSFNFIHSTLHFNCDSKLYSNGICASGSAESTTPNKYVRVRKAINATLTKENKFECDGDERVWWSYCCTNALPKGEETAKDCVLGQKI